MKDYIEQVQESENNYKFTCSCYVNDIKLDSTFQLDKSIYRAVHLDKIFLSKVPISESIKDHLDSIAIESAIENIKDNGKKEAINKLKTKVDYYKYHNPLNKDKK